MNASVSVAPQITIVLDRLRSAHNTGNIYRLADAVGAKEIIACGYTPYPPHPKLEKTAMGAQNYVHTRHFPDSFSAVKSLLSEGVKNIYSVEAGNGYAPWECEFKSPLALIFGNEALGIMPETLALCQKNISLPMFGVKKSINVGNCAAVALYFVIAYFEKANKCSLISE